MLTNADLIELVALRHDLHRHPEVSGHEVQTAARIVAALGPLSPDQVVTGLGGHGVAAVWNGGDAGPTVMFRAELDALPIEDLSGVPYASLAPGTGHLCGHDGHMTVLAGLARLIARRRPVRGRVVLLFQPAEEDGSGAAAVIADPRFAAIAPDWAFAIHNMPGIAFGTALLAPGPANCASMGLRITLGGRTAHASQPEAGVSPAAAVADLIGALQALGPPPLVDATRVAPGPGFRLVTLTHARVGVPAFGIAPGEGEVWVTLRTAADADMAALLAGAEALARDAATQHGLTLRMDHHDVFAACTNDAQATDALMRALPVAGLQPVTEGLPFRASEDFGRFGTAGARAAMAFVGAGTGRPMLHNPDYDFPDDMIMQGVRLFDAVLRDILGPAA